MILAIETATRICSVALFDASGVIGVLESDEENAHSRILHVLIDRLMKDSKVELNDISAIAVSKGPGSYTGLRIGVSAAKGLCYAKNIPLIAINTLESLAYGMQEYISGGNQAINNRGDESINESEPLLFIPMIDARRMEVYSAIFDNNINLLRETEAEIITDSSFENYKDLKLIMAGDGAEKCKTVLTGSNHYFMPAAFNTSARFMQQSALKALNEKRFENTAYFEPFYLKDFIAGKPKVKGLE
jgi:tRNA threonylcarbamoyladenosine biosynthesis protein TsaB